MFYSQFILAKKGPLGTIWIAAHLERKLRKNQVADTDIGVSVDSILFPEVPIALRLSSHLLLGVVRIYSRKVNYLFDDCSEALLKIKQAFRSTAVDLPPEESTAPYHSITLPETFDLDDFELPDNDFFQGNYVDHHISTREQITLQDTMDGVVYSTSQFGLDERFGDGDASQIGLDLDEELLLDKVTAADNGESVADPQASAKPMTPWEQDNISEQINEISEAATVNDRADQIGRLGLNAEPIEYAEAPSTPGLVQEPNLSSVQKALAGDDHVESEYNNSNEFMSTESRVEVPKNLDFHHGDSHAMKWPLHKDTNHDTFQCMLPEENGHHARGVEVKQAESLGDSAKSLPLISDGPKDTIGQLDGSNRLENMQNVPSMLPGECPGVKSDVQDPSHETCKASTHVPLSEDALVDNKMSIETNMHIDAEVTKNVAVSCLPVVVDSEVHADQEPEDPKALENHVAHEDTPSVGMNVLKQCSSHPSPPDMSSRGHDNSMAPNLQSVEVEPRSSEICKRNKTYVEVQECCVTDIAQSEKSQISGPSVCGDIQADNGKLDGPLANASSSDNQLKEVNNSMSSNVPPPEMLLSVPEGVLDKPNDLLVESTPEREALAGSGVTDAGKLISGKKRSYTESTVTVESLNSSESFGVDRSKRNSEFMPDDDDLLSSILVGRKSSVLKMKPTPPAPEIASRKRARSVPQTSALKRKVLMDDMMVLHGDIIRQQLTSTEDIRRVRKKAPCTCPEILMIQIQFLEDEIFNEPIFTGMSAELTSLHCEKHDLRNIRVLETDERHDDSKVAKDVECSVSPNVTETGKQGSQVIVVLSHSCEAQPGESAMQTEIQQDGHQNIGYPDAEAQEHTNSVTDVLELKTVNNESLTEVTEMDIDRGNIEIAEKANCFLVHGIETLSQADVASVEICNLLAEVRTNSADGYLQMDASCLTPEQKVDTHPVEENASLRNISKTKVVEDIVAGENEAEGRDEDLLEEGKVGPSVENGADVQTDCMKLPGSANTHDVASLETGGCGKLASANGDNSGLGVMNDGVVVLELGTSNHSFGKETAIDSTNSVKLGGDREKATLEDFKNQVDLLDHPAIEDCREFEEVIVGNDTEFLNVDDDEVAQDYEDGNGYAEETRLLENSGWSSRTRAVAKYLQALYGQETVHGKKVLSLDHLLAGKTRKEASRMFFETLVLKTKDYIHVEQVKPLDNIHIKPRGKLMKSDF